MSYAKDSPVPPLPIEAKRVISKRLVELFYPRDDNAIRVYFRTLSPEQLAYAKFWCQREVSNPEWRKTDPHQGKPMKAHLSLVR